MKADRERAEAAYTSALGRLSLIAEISSTQKLEIFRYLAYGEMPGLVLRAIISNDLRASVIHGDILSSSFRATVGFFYDFVDAKACGSEDIMQRWMKEQQEKLAEPTIEQKQQAVVASLYLKDKVELQQAAEEILLELFYYLDEEEVDEYYDTLPDSEKL